MTDKFTHIPAAYEIVSLEYIDEIKSQAALLRHRKTGARIAVLANDDENKTFNIGFRTPPKDSTGVAHIMEHSVLCGSEKFPAKDPFVELAKGSLNTFLNAMTYPDKTVYPIASCNDADFQNLMHVYLDAVFHPNIYIHDEIFRQEGWHYELTDKDAPLIYNGVVYNEMKGAFSAPEQILYRKITDTLFPDTIYSVESGGDPDVIPQLTYAQFLDFHRKYYHPSNSYIYLYGNIMKYVEEWAAEAQKAVVYTNAFAGAIYQFEGKVDGRNHGYQGVLLDIGMTSGAIQIYGRLEADKQKVDWLNYAYCYNNRAYHKGITLSDAEGGERDLARAYEIVSGMPERDAKVLSAMGTFSNNMAALMSKWHYPLAEASVWSHRSIEARRQLMYLDFAENAENYMQSLLNYAGLLCKYGAMDELASLYQEINTICDEINAQYPDAYGMLRPKGNRVNFGYVFQRASMRTKYAQSLAEKGKTMAGDSDCYEKAAGLYEESLTELRELLAFTGGEQMAVHEALYKACFYLGRIYVLLEQQEKADACWNESFMHIHKLKSRGKLYQNGVLEEIKGMFPEAVQ